MGNANQSVRLSVPADLDGDAAFVRAAADAIVERGEPITIETLEAELTARGRPGAPLAWCLREAWERGRE